MSDLLRRERREDMVLSFPRFGANHKCACGKMLGQRQTGEQLFDCGGKGQCEVARTSSRFRPTSGKSLFVRRLLEDPSTLILSQCLDLDHRRPGKTSLTLAGLEIRRTIRLIHARRGGTMEGQRDMALNELFALDWG